MKKLRKILLIVFVVSALALAFVACSQTLDTEHTHRWGEWSADTATCTQGGTQTRTCTSEGCKGQDGKPATETRTTTALGHNVTSWTLCESDHSKHEGVCSRTDCGETVTQAHNANAAGTECVDCGATLGNSEQCLHPNASATSTTAATCTSAKIEHWTCPNCDWTDDRTVGTPLGHDYTDVAWTPDAGGKHERECARDCGDKQTNPCNSNGVITGSAATCEAAGRENGTKCSVCGGNETLGKVINPLGHEWGEWGADTATCTAGGTQERTCERDGCDTNNGQAAVDTRTTEALGHNVTSWTLCESNRSKHEGVCSRTGCGVTVTAAHTANEAGTECVDCGSELCLHPNASVDSETPATCTSAKIEHWSCPDCGWTEDKSVGTALGHDYTDVAWTPAADGTHERACARGCGDKQTGTCDDEAVITGSAATCEAAGRENGTKCSVCGGNQTLGAVINALGHEWGEWSADTATCTAGGTQERTCTRNGCDTNDGQAAVDTRTTNALGHDEYKVNETAATCTANKVEHWACSRGDWTDDKEIADTALGHDYTDVAWTFVVGGTHERVCAHGCGDKQTGTCDSEAVITGTAATCTAAGRENGTKCSVCGGNEVWGAVINALGHSLSVDSVTDATCTAAQVNHMRCSRCDYTEDQTEGEALGHDFTGDVLPINGDATHHAATCSRCDELDVAHKQECGYTEETVDADGHHTACVCGRISSSTPHEYDAATQTCGCGKINPTYLVVAGENNTCALLDFTSGFASTDTGITKYSGSVEYVRNGVTFTTDCFNNNNKNTAWKYIRAGNRNGDNPQSASIAISAINDAVNTIKITTPTMNIVTSVVLTIKKDGVKVDEITLNSNLSAAAGLTFNIANPTAGCTYEIVFNMTKPNSNGGLDVSKVELIAAGQDHVANPDQTPSVTSADCMNAGKVSFYCTTEGCTTLHEVAIPKLAHTYGEWIDEVAATCAAAGIKGHFHCNACGNDFDSAENEYALLDSLTIAINPDNHSQLSPVEEQDPTCENAGCNAHYVCDGCGKKYETEDATAEYDPAVEALGHDLQYRANGTDNHEQYCTRGDYVGEAAAHTATTWVKEPDGHHKVCTVCGLKFNEEEHTYIDGVCVCGMEDTHEHNYTDTVTKQPTCTEKGVRTYKCDGCDDTYTEDIDALGHDKYMADETAETCTTNRVEHWACRRCEWTEDKEIDETALGHDFTGDVVVADDDETYHATECSRCDALDLDNKHAAVWGEYSLTADETQHYRICQNCGIQSTPVDHSATAYTYAGNGEHSGECVCGTVLTEACTPEGENNACTGCGRIIFNQNSSGSATLVPNTDATSTNGNYVTFTSGNVTFVLNESGSSKGGFTLYSDLRFYSGHTLTFTVPSGYIATVVLTGTDSSRKAQNNITINSPASATAAFANNGLTMTITNSDTAVREIEIKATSQVRLTSITVTYHSSFTCYHDGTVVPCTQSAATCEGTGISQDCFRCTSCNLYFTTDACTAILENAVVDALGHTYGEWIDEVAATCTTTGTKGHFHCNACDNDFDSEQNEYALLDDLTIAIDPDNHVAELTHVTAQAATTCDTTDTEHAGHVEYWQCACGVMYADANRDTVIDSVESIYLDHTPNWTSTDSGHSGKCSVCNTDIAEQQHVWNEDNTECTICGYEKPAGKHYVTTVIIVDGEQVAAAPTGVTLTWDPAGTNGAFNVGAEASLEISLSGYNLVSIVVTDSMGNETEDWEVDGNFCMGDMNDDYTVTITLVSIVESQETEISITGAQMLTAGKITTNSYTDRTITGEALGYKDDIEFVTISAAKQTQTITDIPVTKTKAMTIKACEGKSITHLELEFRQWGSNALGTISITITYDGGKTATITGSSEWKQSFDLSEYSNVTEIAVTSTNTTKQAGIAQIDLKVK
ncbi:MAG: hypothetical protein K2J01_00900 [Clostridiales bacterium]|nr:hypothetical protein [Clostridiales bacterium]